MSSSHGRTTLGEALACLAIVAVVAMLLSSLVSCGRQETARESPARTGPSGAELAARDKSTCMNNLKECALALQLYWGDYNGTLPSSALAGGDFETFGTRVGELPPPMDKPARTWPQILYTKMHSRDIIYCPRDKSQPGGRVASYWWKYAADRAWNDPRVAARTEKSFVYISDQIIFYEHKGWHTGDRRGLANGITINVAYMDTHVRAVTIANGTRTHTQDAMAKAEPMYYNFDNRAPKGTGMPVDYNADTRADARIDNPPPAVNPPPVSDDPNKGYWNPNFYSDLLQ